MIKGKKRLYLKVVVLCLMVSLMSFILPQAMVPASATSTLLFRSGFEPNTAGVWDSGQDTYADITGIDNSVGTPNNWASLGPRLGGFSIGLTGGTSTDRGMQIITDPTDSSNKVMKFWLKNCTSLVSGNYYRGRVQSNWYNNPQDLREVYQKYRMYLHPDIQILEDKPGSFHWFTIAEYMIDPNWETWGNYPYRLTLGLGKEAGAGMPLQFELSADYMTENDHTKFVALWDEVAEDVTIPFGTWLTCELYYKIGDEDNGRFYFSIKPEGGSKTVVFDYNGRTYSPTNPSSTPNGLTDINLQKLYAGSDTIHYIRDNGGIAQIYFDDIELWEGPPVEEEEDNDWNIINDDLNSYTSGWTTTGSGGSVTQNSGYVTVVDGTSSYYYMTRSNFTAPTGAFTFETRAKANASGTLNEIAIRSDEYLVTLCLPYGTTGAAQDRVTSPTKTYTLDTTVYHTYRVVVNDDYTYDLYVDGSLAWSGSAGSQGTGTDIFKFGGTSSTTSNLDVDYVRMGSGEIIPTPVEEWDVIDDDLNSYTSGWTTTGSGGSVTQNSGYVTVVDGTSSYYYMTRSNFTAPTGAFTFETRAKANASGTLNEIAVRSGQYLVTLCLPYGTSGTAQDRVTSPTKSYTLNTTVYHTYRVVVHENYTYDLYVDGVLRWSGSTGSQGTGTDIFKFGGTSSTTSNMDIDYIRMASGELIP